jgi:hypothetical protein
MNKPMDDYDQIRQGLNRRRGRIIALTMKRVGDRDEKCLFRQERAAFDGAEKTRDRHLKKRSPLEQP